MGPETPHFENLSDLFIWMVASGWVVLMAWAGKKLMSAGRRNEEKEPQPQVATLTDSDGNTTRHEYTGDSSQMWDILASVSDVQKSMQAQINQLSKQAKDQTKSIQWLTAERQLDHEHINALHDYIETFQQGILSGRQYPPFDPIPQHGGPNGCTPMGFNTNPAVGD